MMREIIWQATRSFMFVFMLLVCAGFIYGVFEIAMSLAEYAAR